MLTLNKTTKAENDLIDIWLYSFDRWGETQADHYIDQLGESFSLIAEHPKIGKSVDDIRPGYRAFSTGRHIIFYKVDVSSVWIIRVLHESMAPDQHL